MKRKLAASIGITAAVILGTSGAALANDCLNLSRPHNGASEGDVKGRWLALDIPELGGETWLFLAPDNFMNGQGDALLTNAACPSGRLEGQSKGSGNPADLSGIWSEDCFAKASGGGS